MSRHEDEYADLIEQLQAERPSAPEPDQRFSHDLRGHLLAEYDKGTRWGIGRLTGAATVLAVFALVIFAGWYITSSQQPTIAGSGIETTRPAETADTANELEVVHTTLFLQVRQVIDESYTWSAMVEHWQTADGQFSRTIITDLDGNLLHFAQSDGTYLWLGEGINPIISQNRRVLDFSQQTLSEGVAELETGAPFYADLGWGRLSDMLVSSELDCSVFECIEEMVAPALVGEALQDNQTYEWDSSLIETVVENGRNIQVYRINYHDNVSAEALPQERLVKIDADTFEVISISDFYADLAMRHIELVAQESIKMTAADFRGVDPAAFVAMSVEPGQTVTFENGLQIVGYTLLPEPDLDDGTLRFIVFWQAAGAESDGSYQGWIHVVNEAGQLVKEVFSDLVWELIDEGSYAQMEFTGLLPNGRYQIYAGIYDLAAQENLLSESGEDMVLLDTIVIEDADVVVDEPIERFSCAGSDSFSSVLAGELAGLKGFSFEENLQLEYHHYTAEMDAESTQTLQLYWQAQQEPAESLVAFVHVLDEDGQLVQQQDDELVWTSNEYCEFYYPQVVSLDLPDGRYQIFAGVYDSVTGERVSSDGNEMALLDTIVIEDSAVPTDDVADNVIPFGDNIALTYNYYIQEAINDQGDKHILRFLWRARQTPTERLAAFVHLLDENGQVAQQQDQELAWTVAAGEMVAPGFAEYALQSVEMDVPDGRYQVQVGLYDADSGERVTTTQDVDEITIGGGVNVSKSAWLETVTQDGRSASSDTLTVEVVLGYDLTGFPEGDYQLKLHYAHPEWETITDGRAPIDGMDDWMPLAETRGSLTINFTGNPQEMRSIVGTDEPVLVLMLAMADSGRLETILAKTYDSFPLLLSDINEIIYDGNQDNSQ